MRFRGAKSFSRRLGLFCFGVTSMMNRVVKRMALLVGIGLTLSIQTWSQDAKPQPDNNAQSAEQPPAEKKTNPEYSGMYTFLKDGEFVQVTVEDAGRVTGFISRYGDGESDKGAFLDQFFKTGKLDGNNLNFTTDVVHGVSYEFHGSVVRGEGKNPGDDSYFVIKGTLTQSITDVNKKVTSNSRDVVFKMFPQEVAPAPAARN
jgi:hypothetical protein